MQRNLIFLIIAAAWLCWWWFSPHINFYAANYRYNNYGYDDAINAYSSAIKSNRLQGEMLGKSYFGRAQAKLDLSYSTHAPDEKLYDALQDYDKAIQLIPDNPYYYRERGTVFSYLGAYDEAFKDFETLDKLEGGKRLWSLVRKGGLEKRLGEHDRAIVTLQEAIEIWEPAPVMPPNYHLALTYLELQQYENVIKAIDEGEKAQNDYGSAYQIRACAKANLGLYESALADYEKGVSLNRSFRGETKVSYPSSEHNARIEKEELEYFRSLAKETEEPVAERLKQLCFQNWWQLYYDKKRERSDLLDQRG
jgi:tetratricopeptide (TPR) repeat protein